MDIYHAILTDLTVKRPSLMDYHSIVFGLSLSKRVKRTDNKTQNRFLKLT